MELQRNQPLIVIHAEDRVPRAVGRVVEDRVGGERTGEDGRSRMEDGGLQFLHGWHNDFDFFTAKRACFAGVWIEAGDGDPRFFDSATTDKIVEEQTDADDFLGSERAGNLAER